MRKKREQQEEENAQLEKSPKQDGLLSSAFSWIKTTAMKWLPVAHPETGITAGNFFSSSHHVESEEELSEESDREESKSNGTKSPAAVQSNGNSPFQTKTQEREVHAIEQMIQQRPGFGAEDAQRLINSIQEKTVEQDRTNLSLNSSQNAIIREIAAVSLKPVPVRAAPQTTHQVISQNFLGGRSAFNR